MGGDGISQVNTYNVLDVGIQISVFLQYLGLRGASVALAEKLVDACYSFFDSGVQIHENGHFYEIFKLGVLIDDLGLFDGRVCDFINDGQ